jgi:glycosyltransferase involved in cell wall biosynthesis
MNRFFSRILKRDIKFEDDSFKQIPIESIPPLSIIIPTYEMKGQGAIHLKRSLDALALQSWKNFEVIITDHSVSDLIKDASEAYTKLINIKYFKNEIDRGSSCSNANNGIEKSNYDYVKFLFQDDFLTHEYSLEWGMKFLIKSGKNWVVTACNHLSGYDDKIFWNHYPKYVKGELFKAINSLGCPSVTYMKKSDIRFDNRLPALMDLDYYEQYVLQNGKPALYNDINVTVGFNDLQITHNGGFGDKQQVAKELKIVADKYKTHA